MRLCSRKIILASDRRGELREPDITGGGPYRGSAEIQFLLHEDLNWRSMSTTR